MYNKGIPSGSLDYFVSFEKAFSSVGANNFEQDIGVRLKTSRNIRVDLQKSVFSSQVKVG